MQSRRDFGKILLSAIPAAACAYGAAINSKFGGVQIGAISYSFRSLPTEQILPAFVKSGLSECELMSNHAEALVGAPSTAAGRGAGPAGPGAAGAPTGKGRGPSSDALEALRQWRASVSMDKYKELGRKFEDAGVKVQLLCYNLGENVTDEEIDYSFQMAKALGVRAISSSTKVTVAKRVAPFADKHKIMWGGHGHDRTEDPNEFATPESFATIMSYSKYIGVNLDIGHFTAGNYDAVAYIKEHHARITNLHLKDRKKNHGPNMPWGQGETPIKEVLSLLKKEKYSFPANIEYEYMGADDPVTEVSRCAQFCKEALA